MPLERDDCQGCIHLDDDMYEEQNVDPACLLNDMNLSDMDKCPLSEQGEKNE